tara:strand:+ start:628 stop:828 length:201 start_codon:yes stop_codon:yes gene_type:complete
MPRKQTIVSTQAELEKHEAECAIRYQYVLEKIEGISKRIFRIEAMMMISTISLIGFLAMVVNKMLA